MPWPKGAPLPSAASPHRAGAAVPSSEAVRVAALSASWVRDRQLRRRRLAWRWLLWGLWRIGLPLLLVLALATGLLLQMPPSSVPAWLAPIASSLRTATRAVPAVPPATGHINAQKPTPAKEP